MAARRRSIEILPTGELGDERLWNLYAPEVGQNVCFWLLADIQAMYELRLLYPRKRTFRAMISAHNSVLNRIDMVLPSDCDLAANCLSCQLDHLFTGLKFEFSCVELTN